MMDGKAFLEVYDGHLKRDSAQAALKFAARALKRGVKRLRSLRASICERCYEKRPLTHHVTSEELDMYVCEPCALIVPFGHAGVPGALTVRRVSRSHVVYRCACGTVLTPENCTAARALGFGSTCDVCAGSN